MLCSKRDDYKKAALTAKKSGDAETARKYLRVFKVWARLPLKTIIIQVNLSDMASEVVNFSLPLQQFESVISALEEGKPVDLSRMPGPPGAKGQCFFIQCRSDIKLWQ